MVKCLFHTCFLGWSCQKKMLFHMLFHPSPSDFHLLVNLFLSLNQGTSFCLNTKLLQEYLVGSNLFLKKCSLSTFRMIIAKIWIYRSLNVNNIWMYVSKPPPSFRRRLLSLPLTPRVRCGFLLPIGFSHQACFLCLLLHVVA